MPTSFAGDYYATTTSTGWAYDNGTNATSTGTWTTWVMNVTSTSNTVTCYPVTASWSGWNLTYQGGGYGGLPDLQAVPPPPVLTPEEIAQRAAAEEQRRRAREAAAVEQRAAIVKAKALLESVLTSEQIAQLAANRWFEVLSQHGRRYRINYGQVRNIDRLTAAGQHEARFCIHPEGGVPDEDAMLAQMLLLKTDEDMFLRIANRS